MNTMSKWQCRFDGRVTTWKSDDGEYSVRDCPDSEAVSQPEPDEYYLFFHDIALARFPTLQQAKDYAAVHRVLQTAMEKAFDNVATMMGGEPRV